MFKVLCPYSVADGGVHTKSSWNSDELSLR